MLAHQISPLSFLNPPTAPHIAQPKTNSHQPGHQIGLALFISVFLLISLLVYTCTQLHKQRAIACCLYKIVAEAEMIAEKNSICYISVRQG